MLHWLKRKSRRDPTPAATAGQTEATKELGKAEARLEEVQHQEHEILAAAEKLRKLGERNDFAARIREAMGG